MKLKRLGLILSLTLASTSLFAAQINKVIVGTNSLSISYNAPLASSTKIKLGGQILTWHQLGKTNIIATLPEGLAAGTYALKIGTQTPFDVTIGAQGTVGPQGPQGPQGDVGPQGPAGTNGADGAQGPQGPQGPQGDVGPQGPQGGVGPQGPAGTNGVDGAQGPQGEVGPQGPAGTNGVDGAVGPQGPEGPAGGLVGYLYAYAAGSQTVANNGNIVYPYFGANTGGGNSWSTNGSTFTIPTNGVYQISFHVNGAQSGHTFKVSIVDSPNSFVTSGVDPAYFEFDKSASVLDGRVIVECFGGDQISVQNVSGFSFTVGNGISTNNASANFSITQLH